MHLGRLPRIIAKTAAWPAGRNTAFVWAELRPHCALVGVHLALAQIARPSKPGFLVAPVITFEHRWKDGFVLKLVAGQERCRWPINGATPVPSSHRSPPPTHFSNPRPTRPRKPPATATRPSLTRPKSRYNHHRTWMSLGCTPKSRYNHHRRWMSLGCTGLH